MISSRVYFVRLYKKIKTDFEINLGQKLCKKI